MKRTIYYILPANLAAWILIGVFSLVDVTLARENPMGFLNNLMAGYGLVIFTLSLGGLMIGMFKFLEWLDNWSSR